MYWKVFWCKLFKDKQFVWKKEKYDFLLNERNIDLVKVKDKLINCEFKRVEVNKNYPNQFKVVILYDFGKWPYPVEIAFSVFEAEIVIYTVFPNRKLKDLYCK